MNIFRLSLKGRASFRASPYSSVSKESVCICRRSGFNPWVRKIPWRRKWQPTPVSVPGKFHGQTSLVGCSPWGHKELGMTERLTLLKGSVIFWARGKGTTEGDKVRKRQKIKEGSGTSLVVQRLRLCSHCRGSGFHPWLGNWILHAATKIEDPVCHN